MASAVPALGRVVRGGVVHADGRLPIDTFTATELTRAGLIGLDEIRSTAPLAVTLAEAAAAEPVLVCDSETDTDLDAVVAAALTIPGVRLAGAGGLAAALGRTLSRVPSRSRAAQDAAARSRNAVEPVRAPVLVVVGTAEPSAAEQTRRLITDGANEIVVTPTDSGGQPESAASFTASAVTVVRPAPAHTDPQVVVDRLAAAAAHLATGPTAPDLVLTGGETARRVLDRLGVTELEPIAQIHHGAVRSRTADGRHIVTRPGSFGGPDSLRDIVRELRAGKDFPMNLPVIAVTMGDGAGIGPEVVIPAVLHPDTLGRCRPIIIGDAARLRTAASILGSDAVIVPIDTPGEAVFEPSRVNVIDLGLLPDDLPWGRVSPVAGDARRYTPAATSSPVTPSCSPSSPAPRRCR
jgi:4-hydroxythreonine-4-phosphate dehydrogenase